MKLTIRIPYYLLFLWLTVSAGLAQAQDTLAYYPFSGNVSDQSGYGNNPSVNGAQLTQDRFGLANSAISFDGTQAYLQAANASQLNSPYTTVSFWIKVNKLPGQGEAYLLSFGGWQERWKVSLPDHGKLVWTTNNTSGISDMDAGDANKLTEGVWKHVVFVHDGTKDHIYINGVQAAEKNVAGTLNSTTRPLGMGFNPIDIGNYFNGTLDDILILDNALNATQVATLYAAQNTKPVVAQSIVANYKFNNSAADATTFANNGVTTDVTPATDRFGYGASAYSFNGTSSKVTASNSAQLNSDYTTLSFWVKVNKLPAQGEAFLFSFGGWQERWKVSLPDHGKVVWTTNNTSGISDMDAGDANKLPEGAWRHVVLIHNGTQDKIFINGVLAAQKNVAGTLNSTTKPLGIGYNAVDGGNFFNGVLDEVEIYNYALSDAQVATLYTTQSTSPATAADLVAAYPFAGDAADTTQFGNDGVVGGATLTTDRFGYASNAYRFDGNDSIYVANSTQLNSDFTTIGFWVKVNALPAQGEAYLLSNGGWQQRWKISLPNHGKPVFTTNATSGISDMDSNSPLPVGQWKYVVFVHDGTTDKIYIDGALANQKNVAGALNDTGFPLSIGNNPIDGGNYFNGDLDDLQIYNKALTAAEITALYNAQKTAPVYANELVADYQFNGNANDATPFNNHAQVSGAQLAKDRFNRSNNSYSFDGANDKITAPNSPQLNSDYATVSFWVNVNALPGTGEAFLMSFGGWQERWKISLPSHGKPVWTTNNTSGISDMDSGDGKVLVPGQWKHLVFVHNGTQDKIYFDGAKVAEKNVAGTLNKTTRPLGIGFNPIDTANYFNGSLDEVQIYNRALTDAEIAALYAQQATAPINADTQAPSAPLSLTATVNFTNVTLNWQASSDNVGVTAYNVFQDSVKIATTTSTTLALQDLASLTDFVFGVSAVDAAGNESATTTLKVTSGEEQTPDTTPPSKPGNFKGDAGSTSVALSWSPSTDDRRVVGYVVLVDGVIFDTLGNTATSVFVSGLEAKTLYTFEIYAFDGAGNKSEIADVTVETKPEITTSEPGLVAWYPFEGNANDVTPYANHGKIGGNPTFQTVQNRRQSGGMAIKFDGNRDSVLAPNAVQLISDYTTVSFWIRVDSINTADAEAYVLDFGHWSQRWKISLPNHTRIVWTTNSKNSQFDNAIVDMDSKDGNELLKGFWWYVTMVHDGTNNLIYIDGVEVNRQPALGTLNSTNLPFGMGNNPIEGGQYFNGALDEVKVYNKALTAAEIARLYNSGTTGLDDYLTGELQKMIQVIYPNPVKDELLVQHSLPSNQPVLLRVFDASGRQLDAIQYDKNEIPEGQFSINATKYPQGNYSLNFVVGGKNLGSVKFIKK